MQERPYNEYSIAGTLSNHIYVTASHYRPASETPGCSRGCNTGWEEHVSKHTSTAMR